MASHDATQPAPPEVLRPNDPVTPVRVKEVLAWIPTSSGVLASWIVTVQAPGVTANGPPSVVQPLVPFLNTACVPLVKVKATGTPATGDHVVTPPAGVQLA